MNHEKRMNNLLEQHLTNTAFKFWTSINKKIPSVWNRLSSSSKKYHRKEDGSVPDISTHTLEMLYACIKIWRLFDISSKSDEGDTLLLAIALHDAFKYGEDPENAEHTTGTHDKIIADKIKNVSPYLTSFLNENQISNLEEATRYHNGRWSTDVESINDFDLSVFHPYTAFVHFLDMMSAQNLIKIPKE